MRAHAATRPASALALAGCVPAGSSAAVVGARITWSARPYQAGGVWRYPREQFDDDETGLATVDTRTARRDRGRRGGRSDGDGGGAPDAATAGDRAR